MKTCQHINIIQIEECYVDKGELSIIMEYCNGGTLANLLKQIEKLTEAEISYFCRQICHGLSYLHLNKIFHRDIKSDNILLTPFGDVRIADFGLAQESNISTTSMVGTSYWMAPEVILRKPYGPKVDIWSLGSICYTLATGNPPYQSEGSLRAMFYISTKGGPALPNEESYSKEFLSFLDWCYQIEPDFRPTADELLTHPFFEYEHDPIALENKLRFKVLLDSLTKFV